MNGCAECAKVTSNDCGQHHPSRSTQTPIRCCVCGQLCYGPVYRFGMPVCVECVKGLAADLAGRGA